MRILIIIPRYIPGIRPWFNYILPLGLGYISSTLKRAGYDVDCLNLNHKRGRVSDLVRTALDNQYAVVCSGGTSIQFRQFERIIELCRTHRSRPLFVLGGSIVTSEPELIFEALHPDIGVIGEGEVTILALLERIVSDGDLSTVDGIVFAREEGGCKVTAPRQAIRDIDAIPWPDFDGLGLREKIKHAHCNDRLWFNGIDYPKPYPILGSRGCPFRCTFCYHSMKYRERSIASVLEELCFAVRQFGINTIDLYDDCFSANRERVCEFCDGIKALSEDVGYPLKWGAQMLVRNVDRDLLLTMKVAGCVGVGYGFESYSQKVLDSMNKPITSAQIDDALRITREANLGIVANFIFGDIVETTETAKETLDYWKRNGRGQIRLGFVQPYPGSELYRHCLAKRVIPDRLDYIRSGVAPGIMNMTHCMTDREIVKLDKEIQVCRSQPMPFVRPLEIRVLDKKRKTYTLTARCSSCDAVNTYTNVYLVGRFTYGFEILCRTCSMPIFVASWIYRLARQPRLFPLIRRARLLWNRILTFLRERHMLAGVAGD